MVSIVKNSKGRNCSKSIDEKNICNIELSAIVSMNDYAT